MKKTIISLTALLIFALSFGQGENNKHDIDNEDIKNVFEEQVFIYLSILFNLKKVNTYP